jgi:hypothetical protein
MWEAMQALDVLERAGGEPLRENQDKHLLCVFVFLPGRVVTPENWANRQPVLGYSESPFQDTLQLS